MLHLDLPPEDLFLLGILQVNTVPFHYMRTSAIKRLNTVSGRSQIQRQQELWNHLSLMVPMMRDRREWRRERHRWWHRNVYEPAIDFDYWTDREFKENLRMKRTTFIDLCNELRPYIQRVDTNMRDAIPTEVRVAICLTRLSGNSEYRTISNLFCVGISTASEITFEICNILWGTLRARYIRFPTGEEAVAICEGFRTERGMPQVLGALDGTHIPILGIEGERKVYFNYKRHYSFTVQALVDHRYRYLDVVLGWPGSTNDARVFDNSYLGMHLDQIMPNFTRNVGGVSVKPVIIADGAYTFSSRLMRPFAGADLNSRSRSLFNFRHSSARMVVEDSFGRTKGRWRCLLKQNDCAIETAKAMTGACLVLHNICENAADEPYDDDTWHVNPEDTRDEDHGHNENQQPQHAPLTAHRIREAYIRYFEANPWPPHRENYD